MVHIGNEKFGGGFAEGKEEITTTENTGAVDHIAFRGDDIENFEHHAVYDEEKGRIEMYLRSLSEQSITISKSELSITLSKDELIHTENSHKFSISQIESSLKESNFEKLEMWFDSQKYFVLVLAKKI